MYFKRDFVCISRFASFGGANGGVHIDIYDVDLSSAAFAMAFGDPDTNGTLFILNSGSGLDVSYEASIEDEATGAMRERTRITPTIAESTLTNAPGNGIADVLLPYTFYVTPSGGSTLAIGQGHLVIKQGVAD